MKRIVMTAVAMYAVVLMAVSAIPLVAQRTPEDYRIASMEERIRTLEDMQIDKRIALLEAWVMEVRGANSGYWTSGGIGVLMLLKTWEMVERQRSKKE